VDAARSGFWARERRGVLNGGGARNGWSIRYGDLSVVLSCVGPYALLKGQRNRTAKRREAKDGKKGMKEGKEWKKRGKVRTVFQLRFAEERERER
jgi:hypothetical protein